MLLKIVRVVFVFFTVLSAVVLLKTFLFKSLQQVVEPIEVRSISDSCLMRLSQAIKIKTISSYDIADFDTLGILCLHTHIQNSFPRIDSLLTKTVVNKYSLLYEWRGKDESLKPIIFSAHMDVVPEEGDSKEKWEVGAFEGIIKDGFVWGRGALDDKGSVMAILEAVEYLLQTEYVPQRTVYLAFGHDEEVGGLQGAAKIAQHLKSKNVSADFLIDEGMVITKNIVPGMDKPVALVGIAEKGYLSLELKASMQGGHSSMPPKETAIGVLSAAIHKIEKNPFSATISPPVEEFMNYIGPEMPFVQKMAFANRWLFEKAILNKYVAIPSGNAVVRTTTAPTIIKGGIKDNVLPSSAVAVINCRILPGQTIESVKEYIVSIVGDERVDIRVYNDNSNEPSPTSDTQSESFKNMEKTIKQIFPDVVTAPSLMVGGTDTKHYVDVTDNIYRFMAVPYIPEDLKRLHGTDERIQVDDFKNLIRFYEQLIVNNN